MADTVEILSERLRVQEQASTKVWDTLEKLLTAVNEIKISLTHLEVLSKKDAEQDDKIHHLHSQMLELERDCITMKADMKDKIRDVESELTIWRYAVTATVFLLITVVAGNFEALKSFF